MFGTDVYRMRPFSSSNDAKCLADVCQDVYGGTDYLPEMAHSFEEDSNCDFVVMELETTGEMVAAGNRRVLDKAAGGENLIFWIEAIRVSTKYKGRGIATAFMKEICRRSRKDGAREILSCTVETNKAMRSVFGKAGIEMNPVGRACIPAGGELCRLPGWSSSTGSEDQTENILKALDLEDLVKDAARSEVWEPIESEEELFTILETRGNKNSNSGELSLGHLPGLGKVLWSSDDLRDSIQKGLVRKMCCKSNGDGDDNDPPAVWALVKDRTITSIRSQYVCSIAGSTSHDFDSAVWEACKSEYVPLLDGNPSFYCLFELPLPSGPKSVLESFPLAQGNEFCYYRWAESDA